MIRSNLATRPFYNERAVRVGLIALAILIALATIVNVALMLRYSRSDTELARQAANDEARADELRAEAARLRSTVDAQQIELASLEAQQANALIDRRTFSWTGLWNQLEATLPPNVRVTSFRPGTDARRGTVVTITTIARGVDDVEQFIDKLEGTGAFADVLTPDERINEEGQVETTLEAIYRPQPGASPSGAPVEEQKP
jgi:Tfp pilus assembly protein PilN